MNWKPPGEEVADATLAVPDVATRGLPKAADNEGDWLCAWCLNRVANERDRYLAEGKSEFVFSNPNGLAFHILTFSEAFGCRPSGVPTLEYTWFPGYAWCYCHCLECGQHLGWFYSGQTGFVGLIRDRIVPARFVRN